MQGRKLSIIANGFTTGGHLILIAVAWFIGSPLAWLVCLVVVALLSVVSWLATHHRYRLVTDTPTSRIGSAVQGYVELVGRGVPHIGDLAQGPRWAPPSLWYRYQVRYRDNSGNWVLESQGTSEETFILEDDSGRCAVDPEGAEVITRHRIRRRDRDRIYEIEYLKPKDELYLLGEFTTVGGAGTGFDPDADVRDLLAEWKRLPEMLLERFDKNGDGQIDMEEWAAVREEARKEVDRRQREMQVRPGVHVVKAPPLGQVYLITNLDPERYARRFRYWSWFHLAVFCASAVAVLVLLTRFDELIGVAV